jgi:hypothetical protein
MNGKIKFHKHDSPAFDIGQKWYFYNSDKYVTILGVHPFGEVRDKHDYEIVFQYNDGAIVIKDIGIFQERFQHEADKNLKIIKRISA